MGSGIKGFKSQKILKKQITNYSENDSIDVERYATIQELTGDKHGLDVVMHGAFVASASKTVGANSNIRVLLITSHGAIKGDQVRFQSTGIEASVLSTPDANTIILGSELTFDPTGLVVDIIRHITPLYNSDGSLATSTSLPVNASTASNQTDGSQRTQITNGTINNTLKTLGTQVVSTDVGMVTNAVIHGLSTAGGGAYVDVKVNPSGALATDATSNGQNISTETTLSALNAKVTTTANGIKVDGSAVTQPVSISGTPSVSVSNFPATQNVAINGVTEDRNSGASSANTLRTVLATRHEAATTPLANRASDGTNFLSSIALAAAQLTSGALTAIRMCASVAMGWDGTNHREFSVDTSGQQKVTLSGITEDRNSGASSANTLRTVLATRHEAAATPLSNRASDGTNFLSSIALAASQLTSGALTAIRMSAAICMGWDGTTHRELAVDTSGNQKMIQQTITGTITSAQLTVGTTAVRATVAGTAPSSTRKRLRIKPSKSNTGAIYYGPSSVTTATGLEIIGPDVQDFSFDASDYYLISDTAGQKVEVLEVV